MAENDHVKAFNNTLMLMCSVVMDLSYVLGIELLNPWYCYKLCLLIHRKRSCS